MQAEPRGYGIKEKRRQLHKKHTLKILMEAVGDVNHTVQTQVGGPTTINRVLEYIYSGSMYGPIFCGQK